METVIAAKNDSIRHYRNKLNQTIAEKNAAIATVNVIEQEFKREVEGIKKAFGITAKNLETAIISKIELKLSNMQGNVDTVYYKPEDTGLPTYEASFNDDYLDLSVAVSPNTFLWSIYAPDSMTYAIGWKKNGFLKAKKPVVNAVNTNPYITITNIDGIVIEDYKPPKIGIGPQLMYDPFSNTFRVGIGITYNLIRL